MLKCKTCSKALYNELWGEYKCSETKLYIYNPKLVEDCQGYKKGEPGKSKDYTNEFGEVIYSDHEEDI